MLLAFHLYLYIFLFVDFEDWKETFERNTRSYFYLNNTKKNQNGPIEYFICNRSGSYTSKSSGERSTKSQGLCKIGCNCTAYINAQKFYDKSNVIVKVCSTHHAHDNDLAHLHISKGVKNNIAAQLSQGIGKQRVLKNIFSMEEESQLQREHLCTNQDLRNISNSYVWHWESSKAY